MKKLFTTIVLTLIIAITTCHAQPKMSKMVRKAVHEYNNTHAAKGQHGSQRRMNAFVKTSDVALLRDNGCRVLASFGDIHIATIPVSRLQTLAQHDAIKRIEAGRRRMVLNDSTAIMMGIRQASDPASTLNDYPLKGKGVVLGVMDIGFDLTHPTFYSADGSEYRIRAMWDQLDRSDGGDAVTGMDTTYVGRQYVGKDALLAIAHSYDGYGFTHGTHTTGTAAGSGWDGKRVTPYAGMAPEADICVVANCAGDNLDSIPENRLDLYNTTLDVLGFKYIFDYAETHGQPCVISFSEGSYMILDEDDRLCNEALSSLLGPGRILCASAGNEASMSAYVNKPQGRKKAGAFVLATPEEACYVMRSTGNATLRITFYPQNGEALVREYRTDECLVLNDDDTLFGDTLNIGGIEHVVTLAAYPSAYNENEMTMEIDILRTDKGTVSSEIPLSLTLLGEEVHSELYGYASYFTTNGHDPELRDHDNTHCVMNPGGYKDVICVGSTDTRYYFNNLDNKQKYVRWGEKGLHSSFSSIGPTANGDIKPDVTAPGSMVISSYSSFYHEKNTFSWDVKEFDWNGRQYLWSANCGTSMSTPAAAGVVATWLQECPTLSPQQVMEVIAATASKPSDFESYDTVTDNQGFRKNNIYGYGIIDARAGLDYIRRTFTGISDITLAPDASSATYDLTGRRVSMMRPGNIYIKDGKKIIGR